MPLDGVVLKLVVQRSTKSESFKNPSLNSEFLTRVGGKFDPAGNILGLAFTTRQTTSCFLHPQWRNIKGVEGNYGGRVDLILRVINQQIIKFQMVYKFLGNFVC